MDVRGKMTEEKGKTEVVKHSKNVTEDAEEEKVVDYDKVYIDLLQDMRESLRAQIKRQEGWVRQIDMMLGRFRVKDKTAQIRLENANFTELEQGGFLEIDGIHFITLTKFAREKAVFDEKYRIQVSPREDRMINVLVKLSEVVVKQNIIRCRRYAYGEGTYLCDYKCVCGTRHLP